MIGSDEETRLVDCVKRAVDLVDTGGLSPTDAVEKVAREEKFGPGTIETLGRAYNTGRQLGQWDTGRSIMDKMATFALCDPAAVVARVYPPTAATPKEAADAAAFAADYLLPPSWLPDGRAKAAAARDLPATEKSAALISEAEIRDRGQAALRKRYGRHERLKKQAEAARGYAAGCADTLRFHMADLAEYFKQASYNRLPFATVEHACRAYFELAAGDLLKAAYAAARLASRGEKTAADVPCPAVRVDTAAEPFTIVGRALKAAREVLTAREWAKEAEDVLHALGEASLLPFAGATRGPAKAASAPPSTPTPLSLLGGCSEKAAMGWASEVGAIAAGDIIGGAALHRAGLDHAAPEAPDPVIAQAVADRDAGVAAIRRAAGRAVRKQAGDRPPPPAKEKQGFLSSAALGGAIATSLNRTLGDPNKTKGELIEDAWLDLEDPRHQSQLRKVRQHSLLNSIITDPHDPISSHHPAKVIDRFNEIAQDFPRTAASPSAIKPLLRKSLAGHTEPFEVKELADIEKGLAATKAPTPNTRSLSDAPDSLLG